MEQSKFKLTKINLRMLDGIIVILAILFVISCGFMIYDLKGGIGYSYGSDESLILQYVLEEKYAMVAEKYHENMQRNYNMEQEWTEHYSIGRYYEASVLYNLHEKYGNVERAAKFKDMMDSAKENMGEFQVIAEDIDEQFTGTDK